MANTNEDTASTSGNGATDKPKLSAAATKKLFATADDADKAYRQAVAEAEALKEAVSDAVEAIYKGVGGGPWEFRGRTFSAAKKNEKYFFKSLGKSQITKIG